MTAVVLATVAPVAFAAQSAHAATPAQLTRGTCTLHSIVTLQLRHSDPGRIEAGFEIGHAGVGSLWRVRLTHDGTLYVNGSRAAVAPGGTFSIDRVLSDLPGADVVSGIARNPVTGESCSVSGTI